MSSAAQVIALVIAATVFVVRLVVALYHVRVDGRIAVRRARYPDVPRVMDPMPS